jgi:hypothetical protein
MRAFEARATKSTSVIAEGANSATAALNRMGGSKAGLAQTAAGLDGVAVSAKKAGLTVQEQAAKNIAAAAEERTALEELAAEYKRVAGSAAASGEEQAAATQLAIKAQAQLALATRASAAQTVAASSRANSAILGMGKKTSGNIKLLGLAAAYFVIKGGINTLRDNTKATLLLGNATDLYAKKLKLTGDQSAGLNSHLQSLATKYGNLLGISRASTLQSEQQLLRFTNVRNELGKGNNVLDRAIAGIQNMSIATGKGLLPVTVALGKALQEPARYLGLLGRQGVTFNASQAATIKSLIKMNDYLDAQKIILAQVDAKYQGAANSLRSSYSVQLDVAKFKTREASAAIVTSFIPAFIAVAGIITRVAGLMAHHANIVKALVFAYLAFKGIGLLVAIIDRVQIKLASLDASLVSIGPAATEGAVVADAQVAGVGTAAERAAGKLAGLRGALSGLSGTIITVGIVFSATLLWQGIKAGGLRQLNGWFKNATNYLSGGAIFPGYGKTPAYAKQSADELKRAKNYLKMKDVRFVQMPNGDIKVIDGNNRTYYTYRGLALQGSGKALIEQQAGSRLKRTKQIRPPAAKPKTPSPNNTLTLDQQLAQAAANGDTKSQLAILGKMVAKDKHDAAWLLNAYKNATNPARKKKLGDALTAMYNKEASDKASIASINSAAASKAKRGRTKFGPLGSEWVTLEGLRTAAEATPSLKDDLKVRNREKWYLQNLIKNGKLKGTALLTAEHTLGSVDKAIKSLIKQVAKKTTSSTEADLQNAILAAQIEVDKKTPGTSAYTKALNKEKEAYRNLISFDEAQVDVAKKGTADHAKWTHKYLEEQKKLLALNKSTKTSVNWADMERTFLSERSSFFASFGSNVFTGNQKTGRNAGTGQSPGAVGTTAGHTYPVPPLNPGQTRNLSRLLGRGGGGVDMLDRVVASRGFASGGAVPGAGNRDTVPAMLTPGEVVLNASHIGRLSRALGLPNDPSAFFSGIQRFSKGGVVPARFAVGEAKGGADFRRLRNGDIQALKNGVVYHTYRASTAGSEGYRVAASLASFNPFKSRGGGGGHSFTEHLHNIFTGFFAAEVVDPKLAKGAEYAKLAERDKAEAAIGKGHNLADSLRAQAEASLARKRGGHDSGAGSWGFLGGTIGHIVNKIVGSGIPQFAKDHVLGSLPGKRFEKYALRAQQENHDLLYKTILPTAQFVQDNLHAFLPGKAAHRAGVRANREDKALLNSWYQMLRHPGANWGEIVGTFLPGHFLKAAEVLRVDDAIRAVKVDRVIGLPSKDAIAAAASVKKYEGGTFHASTLAGDQTKTGYFVSIGEHERQLPKGDITGRRIESFVKKHQELLQKNPSYRIGAWSSKGRGFIDVTRRFATKQEALAFAEANGQEAIWDVKRGASIDTPGMTPKRANTIKRQLKKNARLAAAAGATRTGLPAALKRPDFEEIASSVLAMKKKAPKPLAGIWNVSAMADRIEEIYVAAHGNISKDITTMAEITPDVIRKASVGDARFWYKKTSKRDVRAFAKREGITDIQSAQILAAYSPMRSPYRSMIEAADAIRQYKHFGHIKPYVQNGNRDSLVHSILSGKNPDGTPFHWNEAALKTTRYQRNMLQHLIPKKLWKEYSINPAEDVTNDRWVAAMFKPWLKGTDRVVSGAEYPVFSHVFQELGKKLGWQPAEVQAASWVTYKARDLMINEHKKYPTWEKAYKEAQDAYSQGFAASAGPTKKHGLLPGGKHMRYGGWVPGSGRGDNVPLLATPGELVLPRGAQRRLASVLGLYDGPGAITGGDGMGSGRGITIEHFENNQHFNRDTPDQHREARMITNAVRTAFDGGF